MTHISVLRPTVKKRGRRTEKVNLIMALSKSGAGHSMYLKMSDIPNLNDVAVGKLSSKNIHEGSKTESDNARSYKKLVAQKYFHVF